MNQILKMEIAIIIAVIIYGIGVSGYMLIEQLHIPAHSVHPFRSIPSGLV